MPTYYFATFVTEPSPKEQEYVTATPFTRRNDELPLAILMTECTKGRRLRPEIARSQGEAPLP